jgi:methyltransferase-like protein/cyclopropane fatty-acyl-phospholipid synthase-like methyltransferase
MDNHATRYDAVRYPGHALAQAHPDRLATIAILFGLTPPALDRCRVLELGCGDGVHLTSVAMSLPGAECIGIDLSEAAIGEAWGRARLLGLSNLQFRQLDLLDVDRSLGRFDFIIAHGVYSWVPEGVRDRLMAICKHHLNDNGIVYVSYNTYPGGHMRDLVREMMRYHVSEFDDPRQQVSQARALIKFIIDAGSEPDLYRLVLQKELERINEFSDSSLFHDDLSEHNAPVYFYQFAEHARRHGLKYLSEAHFFEIQTGIFPASVGETINRMADSAVAREQYLDFLKCRRFRQTLLCHEHCVLDEAAQADKVRCFYIASPVKPGNAGARLGSRDPATFAGPKNSSIATDNPLIKAALLVLGEAWPAPIHFSDLLGRARRLRGESYHHDPADSEGDARVLGEMLLRAYAGSMVEFTIAAPQMITHVSKRPVASPLARLQSGEGVEVINLRHFNLRVEDDLSRYLLARLDGSRDVNALLEEVLTLIRSGNAALEKDGRTVPHAPAAGHEYLRSRINAALGEFAEMGLLVA